MYLADYHVHSRISPDASASMQEMAEAAIRLGFQEICFTDHVEPIRFGTTEPRGAYDWDPMIAEFRAARTAVGDRITLRLGAELGDAVWGIRRMESMLAEAPPLDFLIGWTWCGGPPAAGFSHRLHPHPVGEDGGPGPVFPYPAG